MGRSVTLFDSSGARLACANIEQSWELMPVVQARPRTSAPTVTNAPTSRPTNRLRATFDFEKDGVTGTIDMYQPDPSRPTAVAVMIVGAVGSTDKGKSFGQYHVHEFPRDPTHPDGPCSVGAVGGHWNPFGAPYKCDTKNPGTCEVGDLSGKHGEFTGSFFTASYQDGFLPLSGQY